MGLSFKFLLLFMLPLLAMSQSLEARTRKPTKNNPFYVEPYAGYFIGDLKGDDVGDGGLSSYTLGARIGVELPNKIIFGVDYAHSVGQYNRSSDNTDFDYDQSDIGAFIGYHIHPKIWVYGSYIFQYKSNFHNLSDYKGDGINGGINISGVPYVKIGLEYQIRNIKKLSDGTELTASNNKSTTYLLTLRLPVPLPGIVPTKSLRKR